MHIFIPYFMLRKIRIPLAILTITAVTLLFLGSSWQCSLWIGWVAKIQFLPALLALNAGVLVFLILMTLIFGRIYCSVICPLGIMQDGFSWLGGKFRKNRFGHVKEKKWWRYGVLAIFGIALIVGFAPLTTLLAPYSAYGRIVGNLLRPLFDLLHNADLTRIKNPTAEDSERVTKYRRALNVLERGDSVDRG